MFLKKLAVTSNASRSVTKFYSPLNIKIKASRLYTRNSKVKGRFLNGRIICWTKAKTNKLIRQPRLIKIFNYISVSYITSLVIIPFLNKLVGLIFYLTGGFAFLQLPANKTIFNFLYLKPKKTILSDFFPKPTFFRFNQLKIMAKVSFLSSLPNKTIKYIKSSGSVGILMQLNLLNHTALVKLPSGIKKIFSIYTIVTLGAVSLNIKRKYTNTKSGYWRNFGKKPIVRGVARNPVDHPHGGRTKSIKYPRTPWGKTTKFK